MGTATCSTVSERKATRNGQFEIELKRIVYVSDMKYWFAYA